MGKNEGNIREYAYEIICIVLRKIMIENKLILYTAMHIIKM